MKRLPLAIAGAIAVWSSAVAAEPLGFTLHETPQPLPEIAFEDEAGQPVTLADWRGRHVLLNVWATWCVPCREEMPTLDKLQAVLGSDRFEVLALSIDRAGAPAVRRFYDEIGIENLAIAVDASGRAAADLRVVGLPTTVLVGPEGEELGRLIGPAEWDAPEMLEFLTSVIGPWKERK